MIPFESFLELPVEDAVHEPDVGGRQVRREFPRRPRLGVGLVIAVVVLHGAEYGARGGELAFPHGRHQVSGGLGLF